ncbi:MAG: S8 family serine peptidase [Gammaproteobacteria bacterium]|nr:S8 family serine peptidase [Gammaproteobacteria bacterium]
MASRTYLALAGAGLLILTSCGGGGGAGPGPDASPAEDVAEDPIMDRCQVETVEGCLSMDTYRTRVESAAGDIASTPAFEDRWSLAAIGLPEAWAHLRTVRGVERPGAGVTVGVIDTGIDLAHNTFVEGATAGEVTEEFFLGAVDETGLEDFSHGTAVASVIAGRANPMDKTPYTGIAPYATLRMFAVPLGAPLPPDRPTEAVTLATLAPLGDENTELYTAALSSGVDVLNLSFSVAGVIEFYDAPDIRATLGNAIETFAQADRTDKTILVWAAGNSHNDLCLAGSENCIGDSETDHIGRAAGRLDASSPDLYAGMMARIEELRGHSIAAVATGENGEIAPFSNRCGIAADWCIAAPGRSVRVAYFGTRQGALIRDYALLGGTSIAAPMVSGGLALMTQMFRDQLPSQDLVTRLFHTADRSGRYADRTVYGHGLMDLGAALSPVSEPMVTAGDTVESAGAFVQQSGFQLGGAFGTGFSGAVSGREIAAFDALGAPFWYDLGHLVAPSSGPWFGTQVSDFMSAPALKRPVNDTGADGSAPPAALRLDLGKTPGVAGIGHAGLAPDSLNLTMSEADDIVATAFTTEGMDDLLPASGASLSWRAPDSPLGLRVGWLSERQSMLSTTAQGAFGTLAAHSVSLGLEIDERVGDWQLGGGPEVGVVHARAEEGIIAGVSPLLTSAFAVHATRPVGANGMLQVTLGQPLRVEGGDARLSIPVGRTKDGEIVRQQFQADVTPSGRQIDLAVRWERPLAEGDFRLGAVATRHPAHDGDARPRVAILAGWRTAF